MPVQSSSANNGATTCHCFSVRFIPTLDHELRSPSISSKDRSISVTYIYRILRPLLLRCIESFGTYRLSAEQPDHRKPE